MKKIMRRAGIWASVSLPIAMILLIALNISSFRQHRAPRVLTGEIEPIDERFQPFGVGHH